MLLGPVLQNSPALGAGLVVHAGGNQLPAAGKFPPFVDGPGGKNDGEQAAGLRVHLFHHQRLADVRLGSRGGGRNLEDLCFEANLGSAGEEQLETLSLQRQVSIQSIGTEQLKAGGPIAEHPVQEFVARALLGSAVSALQRASNILGPERPGQNQCHQPNEPFHCPETVQLAVVSR